MFGAMWKRNWVEIALRQMVAGLLVLAGCSTMVDAGGPEPVLTETPPAGLERFLVFTDGDPAVTDAVRAVTDRQGGLIVGEVRVAPDLMMLIVSVPPSAVTELENLPGVGEVAPDVAPSPAGRPSGPDGG